MSTYSKAKPEVREMAEQIIGEFISHKPLSEANVKIDFLMAYADVSEDGESKGHALTKNGIKALGITRKLSLKDRAMNRGDAEVCLDGDWWEEATEGQRRALLDHEIHHLEVKVDEEGVVIRDDLKRPKLRLRKHDVEVGWFAIIAGRHGSNSIEIQQAKSVMDSYGQLFWPSIDAQEPLQLGDGQAPNHVASRRGARKKLAK